MVWQDNQLCLLKENRCFSKLNCLPPLGLEQAGLFPPRIDLFWVSAKLFPFLKKTGLYRWESTYLVLYLGSKGYIDKERLGLTDLPR